VCEDYGADVDVEAVLDEMMPLVERIEALIGRPIVVDVKVFAECLECARTGLKKARIDGPQNPNDFKKAGQYAFWIRKLKPFRVFWAREIVEQINALKGQCGHEFECVMAALTVDAEAQDMPRHRYVNEMIAVWVAIAFMTGVKKLRDIQLTKTFLHDLLARLRYDAYTPDNLALLFEAMAQQKR
jgi:hypothetical protein